MRVVANEMLHEEGETIHRDRGQEKRARYRSLALAREKMRLPFVEVPRVPLLFLLGSPGGRRSLGVAALSVVLSGASALGCRDAHDASEAPAVPATISAATAAPAAPVHDACVLRWEALGEKAALPGAPGFEAKRVDILGRAKGEPVLFVRKPERAVLQKPGLEQLRLRLASKAPVIGIPEIARETRHFPEDARALFLSEGYVYSEEPDVATVLVDSLTLGRLFKEPKIFLARGAKVHELTRDRKAGTYRYVTGDDAHEEATLLLGDRLSIEREGLFPLLHRDLSELMSASGADRVEIDKLTEGAARVRLVFGAATLRAVADDDGTRLVLGCVEGGSTKRPAAIAAIEDENRARRQALSNVRRASRDMVRERLRFDEPEEEEGQQDGSLRPLWRWTYERGGHGYRFNDVPYQVFDGLGRPFPPQVCVDFVLDAYERASGTWFGTSGQARLRTQGTIDFDALGVVNRRSAANVVDFATTRPDLFDVWNLTPEERIPYGRRADFFRALVEKRDAFHAGDIVVIHGMKADGKAHYHSFLIDEKDPITGIPIRLAGNAGRPRLQTWDAVMRSAPLRSVRHVLSPRTDWLGKTLSKGGVALAATPSLAPQDPPGTRATAAQEQAQ